MSFPCLTATIPRLIFFISYVAWLAFELVFVWRYLWETKGRTLEQTAALFDGEPNKDALFVEEIGVGSPGMRRRSSYKIGENESYAPQKFEPVYDPRRPNTGTSATTAKSTGTVDSYEMKSQAYDWERAYTGARDVKF